MIDLALDPEAAHYFATPFATASRSQADMLLAAYFRALLVLGVESAGSNAAGLAQVAECFAPARAMRVGWRPETGLLETALTCGAGGGELLPLVQALLGGETSEPSLPTIDFDGRAIRLRMAGSTPPYPLPGGWSPWSGDIDKLLSRLNRARDIIGAHSPDTLPWVADALAEIALIESPEGTRFSATVRDYPGLVYLSLPLDPYDIAARLVHEASHQFFFALQRLTALHDGSDTSLYHSPIKQRGRPIDIILFSFHAFGNGALFDRRAQGDDSPGVPDTAVRARNEEALAVMAHQLALTSALTPAGAMLWRRVADQLSG